MAALAPYARAFCAAMFAIGLMALAPAARAQSAIRVGVIVRPGVAPSLRKAVLRELRESYAVTSLGSSSRRNPVRALRRRIERARLELVVVVHKQGTALGLQYYAASGAPLEGGVRLPVRKGKLTASALRKLSAVTSDRLAAQDERVADEAGVARDKPARHAELAEDPEAAVEPLDADEAAVASDETVPDRSEGVQPDAASAEEDPSVEERNIALTLVASVGSSMYSAVLRNADGRARLEGGAALAFGLGASVAFGAPAQPAWVLHARYLTSVGRQVDELHQGGDRQTMGLRTHRFESDLGLRVPLGNAGWSVRPALGYALRSVAPEVHYQLVPFYTLGGPYLRVHLTTPAFASRFGVRIAPEVQWLPQASARVGGAEVSASRFALAGELAVFYDVSDALGFELSLHESHAFGQSTAPEIDDVHRFVLASVQWHP